MSFNEDMRLFEAALDMKYPNHVKVGDKIELYIQKKEYWMLKETGTVLYVGPGYARAEFPHSFRYFKHVDIPLNSESGTLDQDARIDGCKFKSYSNL